MAIRRIRAVSDDAEVCSEHFYEEDFDDEELRPHAIPVVDRSTDPRQTYVPEDEEGSLLPVCIEPEVSLSVEEPGVVFTQQRTSQLTHQLPEVQILPEFDPAAAENQESAYQSAGVVPDVQIIRPAGPGLEVTGTLSSEVHQNGQAQRYSAEENDLINVDDLKSTSEVEIVRGVPIEAEETPIDNKAEVEIFKLPPVPTVTVVLPPTPAPPNPMPMQIPVHRPIITPVLTAAGRPKRRVQIIKELKLRKRKRGYDSDEEINDDDIVELEPSSSPNTGGSPGNKKSFPCLVYQTLAMTIQGQRLKTEDPEKCYEFEDTPFSVNICGNTRTTPYSVTLKSKMLKLDAAEADNEEEYADMGEAKADKLKEKRDQQLADAIGTIRECVKLKKDLIEECETLRDKILELQTKKFSQTDTMDLNGKLNSYWETKMKTVTDSMDLDSTEAGTSHAVNGDSDGVEPSPARKKYAKSPKAKQTKTAAADLKPIRIIPNKQTTDDAALKKQQKWRESNMQPKPTDPSEPRPEPLYKKRPSIAYERPKVVTVPMPLMLPNKLARKLKLAKRQPAKRKHDVIEAHEITEESLTSTPAPAHSAVAETSSFLEHTDMPDLDNDADWDPDDPDFTL